MLEVRLIGTFDIKCDGKPIIISSRVAQSLFAYLILTAGILHRREKLAGMFWPDTTEEKARAYLRHELWRIRKSLSTKSKTDYLIADDLNISFNLSAEYWLDVAQLKNLDQGESIDDLIDALSIYQGELLPGFYEDWITEEREHLLALCEQSFTRLLDMLKKEQRWQEMLEWAEKWISFGHTSEAAYRSLMLAYDALGDPAKVQATYERCVQTLRDLDLEPSEQTRLLAFKPTAKLHIPIPLTTFIGREKELDEVAGLLTKSRLVTLTGSGGVGKTRLSVQLAEELLSKFPDGVWFLDLAPLADAALMPNTLANLLGLREAGEVSIIDLLINYLRSRTALVIFDNCEHLIGACAQLVHALLNSCQHLSILATSREALRVSGEIPYRVPSLEIPGVSLEAGVAAFQNIESVRLFTERAAADFPGFVLTPQNAWTIAQICQRLDGIPLAIELAAARIHVLTVEQILFRLADRFNLLSNGLRSALPRHQTLRATIEWSYDLLSEKERLLFRRLAVFTGGWTLEAAEKVCSGDGIESGEVLDLLSELIRKSLVLVHKSGNEIRYRRLETIRQYAREKLIESGELERLRDQHLKYFLQLSGQAEAALRGPTQMEWMSRLNAERDNIRSALEWAEKTDVEAGLYLAGRLYDFWESFDVREGSRWLTMFIENPDSKMYPLARAKALLAQGWFSQWLEQFDAGHSMAQECLEIYTSHGDAYGEIDAVELLALTAHVDLATDLLRKALVFARALGDRGRQSRILTRMSWCEADLEQRKAHLKEAVDLLREVGDLLQLGLQLNLLAQYELWGGNIESAQTCLEEAVQLNEQLNQMKLREQNSARCGRLEYIKGNFQQACLRYQEGLTIAESLGYRMNVLWYQTLLGYVATQERNLEEAKKRFVESAVSFHKDRSEGGVVYTVEGMADLYVVLGQAEVAGRLIGWTDAMRLRICDNRPPVEQRDIDRIITNCIAAIGEVGLASAYEEGMKMTLDEAVAYALEGIKNQSED